MWRKFELEIGSNSLTAGRHDFDSKAYLVAKWLGLVIEGDDKIGQDYKIRDLTGGIHELHA